MIVLLPMLLLMPVCGAVIILNWSARFDQLLSVKVNGELTITHQHLAALKERAFENVQSLGASAAFMQASQNGQLPIFLEQQRQKYGFDFLYYMSPDDNIVSAQSVPSCLMI